MVSALSRVVLIAVLALAGCSKSKPAEPAPGPVAQPSSAPAPAAAPSVKPGKDPAAAKQLIATGAVVLDVRTPDEYADGHVPNAVNIPIDDFAKRLPEVAKLVASDKTKPVVVYCAAGARAAKAKTQLDADGYSHVVNGGGFDDLQ